MKKGGRRGVNGIALIYVFVFFVATAITVRLFFIQVINEERYAAYAAAQNIQTVRGIVDRGNIYLQPRQGSPLPVAIMKETHTLYVNPQALSNSEVVYEALAEIVELDRERFMRIAARKNDPYEILATGLSRETAKRIDLLNMIGVGTHPESRRHYPAGSLASQVIGFVSYNNNMLMGTYGIEAQFNDMLAENITRRHVNIFSEIFLGGGTANEGEKSSADVVLTIEPSVQMLVENELRRFMDTHRAALAGAIVMDPETGAIVAMASNPYFDLNAFRTANPETFRNPNVSNRYEMGSIVKALTIAAGLDSGAITPTSTFNDRGFVITDGRRIGNVDKGARGRTDVQGILNHSMNTGAAWVVDEMGRESFARYFRDAFELGSKTAVDLPSEAVGDLSNLKSPRMVEHYTASFGQGITMTPIAATRALAALGNGGFLVEPHVVKKIIRSDGTVETPDRSEQRRILKEETSENISRILANVTDQALLGGTKRIPTHTVGAKTGTAQMPDPETGKYSETDFFHSFFGYFPAYDPEFIVFLYAERPAGRLFASQTLADPFFRIANFLIDYYAIRPDR
jgi:cell division protein FtsI/penicillin-binding protein 2